MLDVYTAKVGNIRQGSSSNKTDNSAEDGDTVEITRADMSKSRLRARTKSGIEIGIDIGYGQTMQHGDILQGRHGTEKPATILVRQTPEKVMQLRFKNNGTDPAAGYAIPVLAGHIIGNRHRPIALRMDGQSIAFPIQDDSERETFTRLFATISDHIEISISDEIFVPHSGADIHAH